MMEELTGRKFCQSCKRFLDPELKEKHDAYNAKREPQFTHGRACQCCYHNPHLNPNVEKCLLKFPVSKDDMAWHRYSCYLKDDCPYLGVCDRCQHIILQGEPPAVHQNCSQVQPIRSHREEERDSTPLTITTVRVPPRGPWRDETELRAKVAMEELRLHQLDKKEKRFEARISRMSPHIKQWLLQIKSQKDVTVLPESVIFTNQTPQKIAQKDILFHMWDTIDYKLMAHYREDTDDFAIRQALRLIFTHEEMPPQYLKMLDELERPGVLTEEQKQALQNRKVENCNATRCGTKFLPCYKHRYCDIHTNHELTFSIIRYIQVRCPECKQGDIDFKNKYPKPKRNDKGEIIDKEYDEKMAPWNHLDERNFPFCTYLPRHRHDEIRKLRMNPFCSAHPHMLLEFKWKFAAVKRCLSCSIQGW